MALTPSRIFFPSLLSGSRSKTGKKHLLPRLHYISHNAISCLNTIHLILSVNNKDERNCSFHKGKKFSIFKGIRHI